VDLAVQDALERALDAFDRDRTTGGVPLRVGTSGEVSLFPREDKSVVVIGHNALGDAVRSALPVRGWCAHRLPAEVTLLSTLWDELGGRTVLILRRAGFLSIDEVAAVPDVGLLDIRNLGMPTIAKIRMVAAAHRAETVTGPVTLSAYHTGELLTLLKRLITHTNPLRKDELAHAVATFIAEALPGASPREPDTTAPRPR